MTSRVVSKGSISQVELIRPKASILVVDLHAQAEVAVPIADVAYVELVFAAEVDHTGRYRFIAEAFAVADVARLSTHKASKDSVSTGSLRRYALAKNSADAVVTADALARNVSKALADAYGVSDDTVYALAKQVFDAAGLSDASVRALSKLLKDGVGMVDSFDTTDGSLYTFAKSLANVAFTNDALARSVSKKLADSASALSRPYLSTDKGVFEETIASQDKSVFAAVLAKAESLGTSDFEVRNVSKLVTDLFVCAEQVRQLIDKSLSDGLASGDKAILALSNFKTSNAVTQDSDVYDLSKLLKDTTGVTDVIQTTLIFIRNREELLQIADLAKVTVTKPFALSTYAADSKVYGLAKQVYDGVGMSDQTGVGDGLAFVVIRTIANAAFITDKAVRTATALKIDAAATADVGAVVNQGYCDLTYFADDYVGSTRSF